MSEQKWTGKESEAVEVAYKESRGSAVRFVAIFNELTEGRARTSAELYFHLPRVASHRRFAVDAAFLAELDGLTDGTAGGVVSPAQSAHAAADPETAGVGDLRMLLREIAKQRDDALDAARDARRSAADGRTIICDTCRGEITLDPPRKGTVKRHQRFGVVTWIVDEGKHGARDFRVHHKVRCDLRDEEDALSGWMELDVAMGPHGLANLVHFMAEPDCDRESLEKLLHRIYFTNGRLDPPNTAFDRRHDDPYVAMHYGDTDWMCLDDAKKPKAK